MSLVPPPREVGGRKLPYIVGSARYDDDPYRGQRRRPWMAFRVGQPSLSFQRDVFINFIGKTHASLIDVGILLDTENDVLTLACTDDDYGLLKKEIRDGLAKVPLRYEPGPLSSPVVLLVLDNCDMDALEAVIAPLASSCYFLKMERDEILEMVDEMEYDLLDDMCLSFAQFVKDSEGLVESIAEKIPPEEKINTFGAQRAEDSEERMLSDAQTLNEQLMDLERRRQQQQKARRAHQHRRLPPQPPHNHQRPPSDIFYEEDHPSHHRDPLAYQKELRDEEVPPMTNMNGGPPGLSHPRYHQEQRYEDQRYQEQRHERQPYFGAPPPGLEHAPPPGIPLREPPGLEERNFPAPHYYDHTQRPPSDISMFSDDEDNYIPSTSSDRRRPPAEVEENGPHILSYEEVQNVQSRHVPPYNPPHRGVPSREKQYSLISKDLCHHKVLTRFEHPFISLAHNLDLLQIINYAIASRDKDVMPYSKKIIKTIFGTRYEQKLVQRWLDEPFVTGRWTAGATTLIFEIMMLFFSTARFQNGYMLTVENFNDAWIAFAESLERTSIVALSEAGVSEEESKNLDNLTQHIDKWIRAAKQQQQREEAPSPIPRDDDPRGTGGVRRYDDIVAAAPDASFRTSERYSRNDEEAEENFRRAQREEEMSRREVEQRERFGRQEPRCGGPEPPRTPKFQFGRQEQQQPEEPPSPRRRFGGQEPPRSPKFQFGRQEPPQKEHRLPPPEVHITDEEFVAAQRIRLQRQRELQEQRERENPQDALGFPHVGGADSDYPSLDLTTSDASEEAECHRDEAGNQEEHPNEEEPQNEEERQLPTTNCDEKPKQPYKYNVEGEDGEYQPPWMKCERMEPPEDYRTLTAVPTLRDYVNPVEPFLRRIVELGTYQSAQHYLDVQFRLMREDLVSPMRDGIDIYRKNGTCKGRRIDGEPCSDITLYSIERVDGKQVTEREGLEMRVIKPSSFDVSRLLENDREMKEMGLVMLSCDRFVEDFHLGHIQQSLLSTQQVLHLAVHEETAPFQPNKTYQMAQATSYLPSYRHVLQNMKNISPFKPIPFERYIVHGKKEIYRPNFQRFEKSEEQKDEEQRLQRIYEDLRSKAAGRRLMAGKPIPHGLDDDDDDYMMMSSSRKAPAKDEQDLEYEQLQEPIFRTHVGVDTKDADMIVIDRKWYKISRLLDDYHPTNMDESQRIAFCNTFKHELSLIQGPPGTGKTHIGVQIVKTMLHNRGHWRIAAPILVVCYTNSGLDNLLERIHQMIDDDEVLSKDNGKPKMIRYGMKCESDYLKRLRVMRWDVHEAYRSQVSDGAQQEQNKTGATKRRKAEKLATSSYTLYCTRNHILSYQVLQPVMKPSFQEEINRFAVEHVDTNDDPLCLDEALACWLLYKDFGRSTRLQMKNVKKNKFEGAPEDSDDEDRQFLTVERDSDDDEGETEEGMGDEEVLDRIFKKMNMECSGKEVMDSVKDASLDEYYTKDHWVITGEYLPSEVPLMGVKKKNKNEPVDENINKMVQDIKPMILATAPLAYHELPDIKHLFSLARPKRWALYMYWCAEVRKLVGQRLPEEIRQYRAACEKHMKAQDRFDAEIMKMPMVIGCTTTGASRLRPIFERIEPRILIVEEAAEVLEAHILSAMISSIEHCVMIGDHKQLRPNPAVHELGVEYGMQISMFERLVERALPYSQLREQHRMNLMISDTIVKPSFYDNVIDAENVSGYPDVSGMATNLFMWSHSHREETPDGISWINTHEIQMTVALVQHLLKQSYKNKDIVVLTTYAAQRNLMTREHPGLFAGPQQYDQGLIPVHTVDSYQGREGKLVIVSLVRSHRGIRENTGVGFLAVANRICVALTRAQHGMYLIGNAAYLAGNARLWDRIVFKQLNSKQLVHYTLPLKCAAHGNISVVNHPSEFPQVSPEGGCLEPCNIEKICGHICRRRCHPNVEEEHERPCNYPCEKTCANQHQCAKLCYDECGQCMQLVEVVLKCGHRVTTPCCRVGLAKCDQPCHQKIECGHSCSAKCGDPCIDVTQCTKITMCRLECGHPKPMVCGVLYTQGMDTVCDERCENRMLTCEHQCAEPCGKPCTLECQEIVKVKLPCGHEQDVRCCDYEPSKLEQIRCKALVPKTMTPCGHTEPVECSLEPTSDQCTRPCPKLLKDCGHTCGNLCGRCFVDQHHKCQQRCQLNLECGHSCSAKCFEPCPPCKAFCANNCEHHGCGTGEKDYGRECSALCVMCTKQCSNKCPHRSCTMKCFEECNVKACNEPCTEKLRLCGHACLGMCGEKCPNVCGTCKRAEYTKAVVGATSSQQKVHRLIQIPRCYHVVSVEQLDEHVRKLREEKKQLRCCMPNCNSLLTGINRYAKYNKRFYLEENKKKLQDRTRSIHTSTYVTKTVQLSQACIEELTMVQANMTNTINKALGQLRNNILEIRATAEQLKNTDEKWRLSFLTDVERCLWAVARLVSITSKQRIQKRKEIPPNVDNLFGKCLQETPFGRTMEELRRINEHMASHFKTWMIGALMPKMRMLIARMTLYQMISAMSYQLCIDKRDISDADAKAIAQTIFAVVRCEEHQSYLPNLDAVEETILRIAPRLHGAKRDMLNWKDLQLPDF